MVGDRLVRLQVAVEVDLLGADQPEVSLDFGDEFVVEDLVEQLDQDVPQFELAV